MPSCRAERGIPANEPPMPILFLARHGNTFAPTETPVMVGRRHDLPLVESGRQQAVDLGLAMKSLPAPARILAGSLQRAQDTAKLMASAAGWQAPVQADSRLMELDYGAWEGLSDAELSAQGDMERLIEWRKRGIWPESAGWSPEPPAIIDAWRTLAADLGDQPSLAVSSNGVLRFALHLIPGAWDHAAKAGRLTMRTGALAALSLGSDPKLLFWDRRPGEEFALY